ncbi:microtubule-associated proteins 1A/1B light chain 3C [Stegastes partitus]|uniref:Microtubule-associated proteins 1A/1B light chain 3C-like n=1 Tax=Stegastes partitus TaxID=144197 RepID=A0A3B4ZRC9_9TELE|nr:PREDICTED: microtubule-associated proteins 1A/1B light chain 3C-like [Stegastes partitus]
MHTDASPHQDEECVFVCRCHMSAPPSSAFYKTLVVATAQWGLLTSTRGDFTVSPGKTATPPPPPLVSANRPKQQASMAPFEKSMEMMPFKQRKCLETRKDEVCSIRSKFPNKLPVIVERYLREKTLPLLDKTKFLVPFELTLGQFLCLLRNKIALDSTQALFLLVAEKSMSCMSSSMGEVYSRYRDTDGFLYITYASQEMFGAPQPAARLPC